jgi:hypothetical protein
MACSQDILDQVVMVQLYVLLSNIADIMHIQCLR